jgi:hypothetical protein
MEMSILIVFVFDSDAQHVSFDIDIFNLLLQLGLKQLKLFHLVRLFRELDF